MIAFKNIVRIKSLLLFGLICFSLSISAQTQIQGTVKNDYTHKVIPFCSIAIKGTTRGTITNENGVFTILADTTKDVFVFAYLGYKTKLIPAKELLKNSMVYLQKSNVALNKVIVHANNDFLYDILSACRKKIPTYKPKVVSKVYLGLETESEKYPVEMLEIYYNGYLNGINIDKLLIKNGRVAWAAISSPTGSRYFESLATSKALSEIDITHQNYSFPAIPLQFGKHKMKKYFKLKLIDNNKQYYLISFTPLQDSNRYFSGEIWIDKNDNLLKIHLNGENISVYPFIPFILDSLYDFSIHLTETFTPINGVFLPDHTNFKYHFTYKSVRDTSAFYYRSIVTNTYSTQGILYFYDYNAPFILPHFDYDPAYDDYRKISFIPYDSVFWDNNNKVTLTETQKQDLGFFSKKGHLLKYNQNYYWYPEIGIDSINPATNSFEVYNIIWSRNHCLSIRKSITNNQEEQQQKVVIPRDLYNFKVQILLDITRVGDSLYHSSYTVFDRHYSFYHLPRYPYSNCFLNIYFDICEIERRKMEKQLPKIGYNLNKTNDVYKQTKAEMNQITKKYLKEVFLGKNKVALQKWNGYVKEHLGIDNIKMFSKEIQEK